MNSRSYRAASAVEAKTSLIEMIHFERSRDYGLIRRILTHSRIYPHISDDCSPPAADYQPVRSEAVWYVVARDRRPGLSDLLGLWMFVPQNGICWEVHTALMPCAWGEVGLEAARMLPAWIWANTPCRRIITNVPSTNRLALHFALNAGMKIYGINEASYLKGGKLCDQLCLGLSPTQETPRREAETARHAIETAKAEEREGKLCQPL
jgi:hypothetical protein